MNNPTILITGASSGIGLATAELYASRGSRLHLVARRGERLEALRGRFPGIEIHAHKLDVRDRNAVEKWAEASRPLLAEVEVLVNSAGLARGLARLPEGEPDDWDEMIDTNVKGLLTMCRAVIPHMVAAGRGHVINIGSVAGRWVYPKGAVYCASKHAERAISEGLRLDLIGTGVRVATVDPGLVVTEFSEVRFRGDRERAKKVYEGLTPLQPRDVAETVAWILDRPRHVNVAELVLYPTDQASPTVVHRRSGGS